MNRVKNISRREVIKLSLPLLGVAAIPGMMQLSSCNPSAKKEGGTANNNQRRKPKKTPVQRGNPYANRDEMFLHNKTKTLHYPYVFKTYDQLKEDHFTLISPNNWEKQLDENGAHFTKEKSALIFERLALKNLQGGINNETLGRSSFILGRSFTADYAKQNMYNWRGYNLLFQMVVLNSALPTADKWTTFSHAIKEVNVSQIKKLPKKHTWIASKQLFDQRVQYVQQNADKYMSRIKIRSA